MSDFRSLVYSILDAAEAGGVTLTQAKLRDAISSALTNRPYSAAMAAESAGTLGEIVLPPAHLTAACDAYQLDEVVFAKAFPASGPDDGLTFDIANLLKSPAPLHCQYDGQNQPQPAYVGLDDDGKVTADYSGDIGNSMPMTVWLGRDLRISVEPRISGRALHEYLLGEGRPLLARIHAGHEVEWDGNNMSGKLSVDAETAQEELESGLRDLGEDRALDVGSVEDFLFGGGSRIGDYWTDQTLETLVTSTMEDIAMLDAEIVVEDADAETVREAFIRAAVDEIDEGSRCRLSRHVARSLYALGKITLSQYAGYIAEHDDPQDEIEADLDSELEAIPLWLMDSGASTEEIERGVAAGMAVLAERGVTSTQAYLASLIDAEDEQPLASHLDAWRDAESAAIAACCVGWAQVPEGISLAPARLTPGVS